MQPIDFPGDGLCLDKKHKPASKSRVSGCIAYGEQQVINFHDGGKFSYDNKHAFTKPLPEGYFAATVVSGTAVPSTLVCSPAVNSDQTVKLTFVEDNGTKHVFTLKVQANCP